VTRDSQRQKVYDAEKAVDRLFDSGVDKVEIFGSTITPPPERKFGDLAAVENYLAWIAQQGWYRRHYGSFGIPAVRRRKGLTKAHYEHGTIAMPVPKHGIPATLRETYALHELAHHLTPGDPGHGPEFAGVMQHLVREAMGPEAGLILAAAFDAGGVKWNYVKDLEGAR
jgi:putative metallohydrolase (TIGR04338 family)